MNPELDEYGIPKEAGPPRKWLGYLLTGICGFDGSIWPHSDGLSWPHPVGGGLRGSYVGLIWPHLRGRGASLVVL